MRYLYVADVAVRSTPSPLDSLDLKFPSIEREPESARDGRHRPRASPRSAGALESLCSRVSSAKHCATFATAARPPSAGASSNAIAAEIASSYITRAGTGTVPSARPRLARAGLDSANPSFYPCLTSTSYSRCLPRSDAWHSCLETDLQHPVPHGRGHVAGNSRRSQTARRPHRLPCAAAYLGTESASASAPALRGARRWHLARWLALDRVPKVLFSSCSVRVLSHRFRKSFLRALRRA